MNHYISIIFGIPKHGWLSVSLRYQDLSLDFDASDGLNNPIEELYYAITNLKDNEIRRVTWWLEPEAYFFDVVKLGSDIRLIISETKDLHNEENQNTIIQIIAGDEKQIIEPFKMVLKQFSSQAYDETHWSYKSANYNTDSL